jgi:hypothetical protein
VFRNRSLLQEHPEYLVAEEPRHGLRIWGSFNGEEGAVALKQTPCDQQMHMMHQRTISESSTCYLRGGR